MARSEYLNADHEVAFFGCALPIFVCILYENFGDGQSCHGRSITLTWGFGCDTNSNYQSYQFLFIIHIC